MWKKWFALGAGLAALAVVTGALGAHQMQKYVESGEMDARQLASFETAARYQMYNAIALLTCGIVMRFIGHNRMLKISAWLFTAGIVCFCGSLYLLSTRNLIGLSNWKWLGPITPLGGICFISGWLLLAVSVFRPMKKEA